MSCSYCGIQFNGTGSFCCNSCQLLYSWLNYEKSPLNPIKQTENKWSKYNQNQLEQEFNISENPNVKKFRIYIGGLQCSTCVHLLEELPNFSKEVIFAKLNYGASTLWVETSVNCKLGHLCSDLESMGYEPQPLKQLSDLESAMLDEKRSDLKRLGVAAAVAANQMLFSVPIYAGLLGDLASVFKWISFALFLPLIFYSAWPFYKKAWSSILVRRINVDTTIVVALLAGFIFSTYSLIVGQDDLYFDSTASFIFLILLTRFLIKQQYSKLTKKDVFAQLFEREIYDVTLKKNSHTYFKTTYDQIKENQIIKLASGQLLPCDAELISADTEFDLSFLNGEAYPQLKKQNEIIMAGSRLLNSSALLVCKDIAIQSDLSKALENIQMLNPFGESVKSLTDIVSHRLTLVVFSLAAGFFIFTYGELGVEAFKRSLALITIACPCAVAFGTPLAQNFGFKKAIKQGFYIKSESVFTKMNKIKNIIFDKTGTLTSTDLKLIRTFPSELSIETKKIILGLERQSIHPVAISLKKQWTGLSAYDVKNLVEITGLGMQGECNGNHYKLVKSKSDENEAGLIKVDLVENDHSVAYLFFEEQIVTESFGLVKNLQQNGYDVFMLSGDRRERALNIARQLGIRPLNVFSEQTIEGKKNIVESKNPALYIGDGLNDLAAIKVADVGYAIKGTFEATFGVSDVYAPQKNLLAIEELIQISKKVNSTIQANILFAIFYNAVGGVLALLGFINPLVAAILMPISSFVIATHTAWRWK